MYLRNKEHNPPHIHAITQDFDAPFLIATGEIMEGEFPPKAKALVKEFILKYQKELNQMWETEQYIMPFASVSDDSEIGRIILLQQFCGLITDENGRDDALKQVNEYLADSGLGDWIGQFYIMDASLRTIIGPFLK